MINPDTNPFIPNRPIGPADLGFFTGRRDPIEEILSAVGKAATGQLEIGWIAGERGIGKSSLAAFTGHLAERDQRAIVAHIHLGGVRNLEDMVQEIHLGLLKDNQQKAWGKEILDLFGERVQKIGLYGVDIQLTIPQNERKASVSNFVDTLGEILKKAGDDRKVIFLILDDVNGLASDPEFPHWLKSTVDSASTRGTKIPICIMFAGLDERVQEMAVNNPSVVRVFMPRITLKPWSKEESTEFFKTAFGHRNVDIPEDALHWMFEWCGGLPTIAHAIGHEIWRRTDGGKITEKDVFYAAVHAAHAIGEDFIERDVIQALKSTKYRSILGKIAKEKGPTLSEFSKKELLALDTLTAPEEKALNNFLTRMRKIGGIIPAKSGQHGVYCFPTAMHQMYFYIVSRRLIS